MAMLKAGRAVHLAGLLGLLAEAGLILCCYTPYWQSWDDPALAMLINGYGLADAPATHIFYCNFLWAWLIRLLPDFFGISNYTWALYFFTLLAACALWLCLAARPRQLLLKFLTVSAILFYAFLNPQFTVTGLFCGLAAICAFTAWQAQAGSAFLIASFCLAFISFIIRDWTLAFMAVLGLPLPDWGRIFKSRQLLAALCLSGLCLAALYGANQHLLRENQSPEAITWNGLRQKLTDAHLGKMLAMQPELLHKFGYSRNDIDLLSTHFSLAQPLLQRDALIRMLAESDGSVNRAVNLEKAHLALEYLLSYPLWLIWLAALLLLPGRISVRTLMVCLLFCLIFLAIGYFNRGGVWISRVYFPAAFALVCLFLQAPQTRLLKRHVRLSDGFVTFAAGALLVLAILAFSKANLVESWELGQQNLAEAAKQLRGAVWYGHPVRIEQIFRPFASMAELKNLEFQAAGWTARLKNSRKYIDPEAADGFDNAFRAGFNIAVGKEHLGYLEKYCQERLDGDFRATQSVTDFYRIQCLPAGSRVF